MALFVLMTKLSETSMQDARFRKVQGQHWLEKVRQKCPQVKWLAHYALLGPYDFMDLYEAPDAETAHMVSLISRAEGAVTSESWQALQYEKYLELLEKVQS
jgi:uncharacterized protein with GYD domain